MFRSIFVLLFCCVGLHAERAIEVISSVTPATDARYAHLLHERCCKDILSAKKSIRILNYSVRNPRVVEALNQKALEGVDIGIVTDRMHLPSPGVLHASIKVCTRMNGEGHYHHKILLVDDHYLCIGTNTLEGVDVWSNLVVCVSSETLAEPILQEWGLYAYGTPRTKYQAEDTIKGQLISLFMMPHVSSPTAMAKEQEANTKAMNMFLSELGKAKKKIVASIVVWTVKDFAREMVKAKLERKVEVICVGGSVDPAVRQILALAGIPLRLCSGLIHHKTLLIDDSVFINGSANFSMSAFGRSDESVTRMDHATADQVGIIYQSVDALR